MAADTPSSGASAPLFLVSFRQRDELALLAERQGWAAVAARRLEKVERRFLLSDARIAVVDARGAFDDGLEALRTLAEPVEANFAALIVLVSRGDIAHLDRCLAAGATHFLASPFGDEELSQLLRYADRYVTRLGVRARTRAGRRDPETLSWTLSSDNRVSLSPALARLIEADGQQLSWSTFAPLLGDVKGDALAAVEKLRSGTELAVFTHGLRTVKGERLIHTLVPEGDGIAARVERPDRPFVPRDMHLRDPLTGLADSHGAMHWLTAQATATGEGAGVVLILLAVDRFDLINQGFGAHAGDAVLQAVARRIERFIGDSSGRQRLIARLAGAEFAIGLAAPVTLGEAALMAQQLIDVIERPLVVDDQTIRIRMRGGVSQALEEDKDAGTILRRASTALSEAREADGEAIYVMDATALQRASDGKRLEADLLPAIEEDEIEILFQPQVSVATGAIVGVEALSRWKHPVFGELGAPALFAAADRADRLVELSTHVLRKALDEASRWPESLASLRIAINVTAEDMARPDFPETVAKLADDARVAPDRITLEITEGGLIRDLAGAGDELAGLRQSGFRMAIDDFGTGYSSLAYLKSLPLDYLKIDSAMSRDIMGETRDRIVVRKIIEMALSLELTVIAEGVETDEQLVMLAREGCAIYQGFLCAPPLSSADLAALVAERTETIERVL